MDKQKEITQDIQSCALMSLNFFMRAPKSGEAPAKGLPPAQATGCNRLRHKTLDHNSHQENTKSSEAIRCVVLLGCEL